VTLFLLSTGRDSRRQCHLNLSPIFVIRKNLPCRRGVTLTWLYFSYPHSSVTAFGVTLTWLLFSSIRWADPLLWCHLNLSRFRYPYKSIPLSGAILTCLLSHFPYPHISVPCCVFISCFRTCFPKKEGKKETDRNG